MDLEADRDRGVIRWSEQQYRNSKTAMIEEKNKSLEARRYRQR